MDSLVFKACFSRALNPFPEALNPFPEALNPFAKLNNI